jgi:hypothetical protein
MEALVMSTRRSLFAGIACVLSFPLLTLSGTGCAAKNNGESTDAQDQADATDASSSNAQSSHFTEMFAHSITSTDPAAAADSNVSVSQLWPAGCATRAKDPTNPLVVVVTLNGCTGPFGLVKLSGELISTFSKNAGGGLHIEVASKDLTANGRPVTESGSGDVTVSGTTRTVAWKGAWTRENLKGETVSHTTDVTLTIDASTECRTANGTAQTNVGTREIDSAMKSYEICKLPSGADGCPTGEITHTRVAKDATLTIDFDGTDQAKVTGPRGNSIEVPLVCTST